MIVVSIISHLEGGNKETGWLESNYPKRFASALLSFFFSLFLSLLFDRLPRLTLQ